MSVSRVRITIEGESYVTLEGIAQWYQCELSWVREVYGYGLLGSGRTVAETTAIHVSMLDRFADVLRMSVYQDIDLAVIAALFASEEP
jgi:hypothetical protein